MRLSLRLYRENVNVNADENLSSDFVKYTFLYVHGCVSKHLLPSHLSGGERFMLNIYIEKIKMNIMSLYICEMRGDR